MNITSIIRYQPRCVNVDLDPGFVDSIKGGKYKNLFEDDQLVHGASKLVVFSIHSIRYRFFLLENLL